VVLILFSIFTAFSNCIFSFFFSLCHSQFTLYSRRSVLTMTNMLVTYGKKIVTYAQKKKYKFRFRCWIERMKMNKSKFIWILGWYYKVFQLSIKYRRVVSYCACQHCPLEPTLVKLLIVLPSLKRIGELNN